MIAIPEEVKQLLQDDNTQKNFRVHFPNGERADITNENIVSESVSFTESICSQSTLKFGLCESPYIEFETYGVGKIKGATIECSIEVLNDDEWYSIPLGTFIVESSKKQADMSYRKVIAYGSSSAKLITDYKYIADDIQDNFYFEYDSLKVNAESAMELMYLKSDQLGDLQTDEPLHNYIPFTYDGQNYQAEFVATNYRLYSPIEEVVGYVFQFIEDAEFAETVRSNPLLMKAISSVSKYDGITFATHRYSVIYNNKLYREKNYTVNVIPAFDNKNIVALPYAYELSAYSIQSIFIWNSNNEPVCEVISDNRKIIGKSFPALISFNPTYPLNPEKSQASVKLYYGSSSITRTAYKYDFSEILQMTVRQISEAYCELQGKFGKTKRDGSFEMISLRDHFSALYPSETLYPSDSLYPSNNDGAEVRKSEYKTVWYDDDMTLPFGSVSCTYKNGTTDAYIKVYAEGYSSTTDLNTYQNYDVSSNEIIKSNSYTETQITAILNEIASNISGFSYMPTELKMQGRPDIEAGDVLEISTADGWITTAVMRRTMTGIQSLTDKILST